MKDIVIDTNVWAHSQNPEEKRFSSAVTLLEILLNKNILLCVDEGYSDEESKNTSAICCEYLKYMTYGSLALSVFSHIASNGRLSQLEKKSSTRTSKIINQLISNKVDRIFLNVSYNSIEKCLISHDFVDFQKRKRKVIKKELSISVLEASEVAL